MDSESGPPEGETPGVGTSRAGRAEDGHEKLASLLAEDHLAVPERPETTDESFAIAGGDPAETFPQSVASGGPTPHGVILWTRIAPAAFDPDLPLGVEVADDPDFSTVRFHGVVESGEAISAHDYTVSVDLDGALDPGRAYHYRFVYDGVASRTGRCRTLPAPGDSPESLSFAVVACQNYQNGYYGAFEHVAREDVDFLLHVGDFVYESGADCFTGPAATTVPGRELTLPSGFTRVETLADYRYLYREYRSDEHLQRALESHTMIAAWDDHEIANDIYWDDDADAPRAEHPRGDDGEFMQRLTADALHAWWEYMPARVGYDPDADDLQDRFRIYRSFEFGDLLDLVLTDERLFRDGPKDLWLPTGRATAPEREPPDRSILGDDQREWLYEKVDQSDGVWTVWADQVPTVPLKLGVGPATVYPSQGSWDGFRRERQAVMRTLAEQGVENLVTLTGDMHSYLAGYQQTDYGGPLSSDPDTRVGVEFMTPAVTSLNIAEALFVADGLAATVTAPLLRKLVVGNNPHIEFFDSHHWGYSVVEFTRERCTYRGYSVDKTVEDDADRELLVALEVPAGEVTIRDVTARYR